MTAAVEGSVFSPRSIRFSQFAKNKWIRFKENLQFIYIIAMIIITLCGSVFVFTNYLFAIIPASAIPGQLKEKENK